MGSGAFLVAACRYLASAYEAALGRRRRDVGRRHHRARARRTSGGRSRSDASTASTSTRWRCSSDGCRSGSRRSSADRPLTFLDHRLRAGNSLVGASRGRHRAAAARQTPPPESGASLPLFDDDAQRRGAAARDRRARRASRPNLATRSQQVRAKEHALARLNARDAPSSSGGRTSATLWCGVVVRRATPSEARRSVRRARGSRSSGVAAFPAHVAAPHPRRVQAHRDRGSASSTGRSSFPRSFCDALGEPSHARASTRSSGTRHGRCCAAIAAMPTPRDRRGRQPPGSTDFARGSGVYALQGRPRQPLSAVPRADARAAARTAAGSAWSCRPALATDHGAAPLRRALLDRTRDRQSHLVREPRRPVSRFTAASSSCCCRATGGGRDAACPVVSGCAPGGPRPTAGRRSGSRRQSCSPRLLLEQLSGRSSSPSRTSDPRPMSTSCSAIAFTTPALGDPDGWHVRSDASSTRPTIAVTSRRDRRIRQRAAGRRRQAPRAVHRRRRRRAAARLHRRVARHAGRSGPDVRAGPARLPRRRLADEPADADRRHRARGTMTTHTVFCLKDAAGPTSAQQYLCGMFNSFVANYLVRLQRRHARHHRDHRSAARAATATPTRRLPGEIVALSAARLRQQPGATPGAHATAAGAGRARLYRSRRDAVSRTCSRRFRSCRAPTATRPWPRFAI